MNRLWNGAVRALLMLTVGTAYQFAGCSAEALRGAAESLNEAANDIDGEDDIDLGDLLADEFEDI